MQKSNLGNTDILITRIGLGTVKWGRNQGLKYPMRFNLPSLSELRKLLERTKELGINFLDTAPAYGESEARIGTLLKKDREHWVICSKAGETFSNNKSYFDFRKAALLVQIDQSLSMLKTDWLDILLIHSNGDDEAIINQFEVFDTLAQLKQMGKIRAYGMSTKTLMGTQLTLKHADIAMVTFNLIESSEKENIANAYKSTKGILVKKALASGHLNKFQQKDPIAASMDFILQTKGVSSVIIGTSNPLHLQEIVDKSQPYV